MGGGKPVIGLVGGIGSGKSTVAEMLEELGAAVISSDRLNQEELGSAEVVQCLRAWWGEEAVAPDGRPKRGEIRRIIAADAAARQRLESLMHPRIARRREELMARYAGDPAVRAVVWDAPLLYEAGLAERCDCVIFVDAEEGVRLARLARARGWSAEDRDGLEKSQKPLDHKRSAADYRVDNNSDFDDLRRQVKDVFSQILTGR